MTPEALYTTPPGLDPTKKGAGGLLNSSGLSKLQTNLYPSRFIVWGISKKTPTIFFTFAMKLAKSSLSTCLKLSVPIIDNYQLNIVLQISTCWGSIYWVPNLTSDGAAWTPSGLPQQCGNELGQGLLLHLLKKPHDGLGDN